MEIPQEINQNPVIKPNKLKITSNKKLRLILIVFGIIVSIIILLSTITYVFAYLPAQKLSNQINLTKIEAEKLKQNISDKDIASAKNQLITIQSNLDKVSQNLSTFSYFNYLPYLKNYYQDSQRMVKIANNGVEIGNTLIKAIEPYQDFLGLKGAATSSAKTTEDRIAFLTQSIESILPHLDLIETKIKEIDKLLSQIDITKYPKTYQNYNLKNIYNQSRQVISETQKLVSDGRPILTKSSWLLGKDKPRNYLIIFQNDGELRPSGGFWTA